ncbi:MAG: glycosyltransferase family 4 protein, partial [Pseudomonadota bacterium]
MRVGVLRTQVPFVSGGAERHAAGLVAALQRHGHTATEITLPFKWYPGEVLADHILAAKLTDLSEVEGVPVDRMIGLKFPAYLARHPAMQFWIMHQHRQAYDQWETGQSDLLDDPDGLSLRALVQAEDRAAFAASPHPIFANSVNVAGRLQRNLGIAARPLYHPPPQAEAMHTGSYGDYLLVPGRINPSKRLELVLEAFARTKTKLRLVIVGTAENPAYAQALYKQSLAPEMAGRIDWQGAVDDATLRRLYADARAVIFVPQDEDYGYITLEAMLAAKPVVTLSDAGGPLEFITHEQEGLVAAPSSADLAVCLDRLMQDP